MTPNEETINTWNNLAALYKEQFMHLNLYDEGYDFICQSVAKNKAKILEVGCGPGNIAKYLLAKRPDFDLFGIDLAPNMVALAAELNPTARFSVMDCRAISQLNDKFDAIIGGFTLPYLSTLERKKLLVDAYQLLHPNGLLYLSYVAGEPAASGFKTSSNGRVYFHYFKEATLLMEINALGYEAIKTFKVQFKNAEKTTEEHTVLIAVKRRV